ncbi:MAG: radical SAM protein [Candidatus Aenigmarchaeota archaeon]|nr:radical SAM protein [Candidatus Aenigmarchaeota archaeon]
MEVKEKKCRTIMSKSGLYGTDYSINPYTGCSHNCVYCYAPFVLREKREWGKFVDVKVNAVKVLEKQIERHKKGDITSFHILMSSVTDPYQDLEKNYKITKRLLEKLKPPKFLVSILTKSTLVLRDLDLLKKMNCEVGLTITTLDEKAAKVFEPGTPSPEKRLEVLSYLKISKVKTYIFFGPLLPFISDVNLEKTIHRFSMAKPDYIVIDRLNIKGPNHWKKIKKVLEEHYPDLVNKWKEVLFDGSEYYREFRKRLIELFQKYDLKYEFCF